MTGLIGFEYRPRGDEVVITHYGKQAAVLRGHAAVRFLEEVEAGDAQVAMARATGNYKRGSERVARQHVRNRER